MAINLLNRVQNTKFPLLQMAYVGQIKDYNKTKRTSVNTW